MVFGRASDSETSVMISQLADVPHVCVLVIYEFVLRDNEALNFKLPTDGFLVYYLVFFCVWRFGLPG